MMTVRLIAHTPEPEKVVAAAAKLCYSDAHITDLLDGLTEEKTAKFLTMLSDLFDLRKIGNPAISGILSYPVSQKRISVKQETTLCNAVRLIVELLRSHFVEVF